MATEPNKIAYGGDMMLFLNTGIPIAFSTDAKLEITVDSREISSKDSGNWKERLAGKLDWKASTDALYTEALTAGTTTSFGQLYALMIARAPIACVFAAVDGTPAPGQKPSTTKHKYTGQCIIIGLSVNAPDNETTTYSISLEGTGALIMS